MLYLRDRGDRRSLHLFNQDFFLQHTFCFPFLKQEIILTLSTYLPHVGRKEEEAAGVPSLFLLLPWLIKIRLKEKKKKGVREALRANLDFKTEGSLKRKIHFLFRREIFIFFSEWKFPVMHFTQNIQTHYFWYYLMFAHPVIFFY